MGIAPARNAVVALNPAAADVWDALQATGNVAAAMDQYRRDRPDRADCAEADIGACLDVWRSQGLLERPKSPPTPAAQAEAGADPQTTVAFCETFVLGGRPLVLEVEDPDLAAALNDMTAQFSRSTAENAEAIRAAGPIGGWRLLRDGRLTREARSFVDLKGHVVGELLRRSAGDDPWRAMIHAAVLTRDDKTILLTGPGGVGKSTLAACLVSRGWRLVAEDIAAFDAEMRVAAVPFSLSIKQGSWALLGDAFPELATATAHRLGERIVRYQPLPPCQRADAPHRPDLILDIRYQPKMDRSDAELRGLDPAEALQLFLNEESFIDFERDEDGAFLEFVAATPAHALAYGSAEAAEAAILSALRHQPAGER